MNVERIAFSADDAAIALREYKQHRAAYDARDWEIERILRAIAKGKKVISVVKAIQKAGLNERHLPRLAVGRADAASIECVTYNEGACFRQGNRCSRWYIDVPMAGVSYRRASTATPRIPPQHRPPENKLSDYWLLWEASWTEIDPDPYLLRRIGKDAWIVLAAWELTPVEIAVLGA
jgi:hypothetical protein